MIPADCKNIVRRVGFKAFDGQGLVNENLKPVDEASVLDVISSLQKTNSLQQYYIHSNFLFSNLGCSGYVADLELSKAFSCDLLYSWLFRVNFVCEIDVGDEKTFIDSLKDRKAAIRAAIPYDPAVCMDEKSTIDDGWSPALGRYGGLIGIAKKKDLDGDKDVSVNRYFVYGRSGIHDDYVNALLTRAHNKSGVNLKPGISLYNGYTTSTFRDEFERGSVFHRAIELAKENCRRLVRVFIDTIGAYITIKTVELDHIGSADMPNHYSIPSMTTSSTRDIETFKKKLQLWPKHATIYPYSTLDGFEIGAVLYDQYLNSEETGKVDDFNAKLGALKLRFDPVPRSLECLEIESLFNTFTLPNSHTARWYSNCTPINNSTGIVVQRSIRMGFCCINSPLFSSSVDTRWSNDFGNAFPSIFPFKPSTSATTQDDALIFDLKGDTPEQLNGSFIGLDSFDSAPFQKAMGDSSGSILPGVVLDPLLVYCSPHIEKSNSFSLYNNYS
jgi:hypothetical protein